MCWKKKQHDKNITQSHHNEILGFLDLEKHYEVFPDLFSEKAKRIPSTDRAETLFMLFLKKATCRLKKSRNQRPSSSIPKVAEELPGPVLDRPGNPDDPGRRRRLQRGLHRRHDAESPEPGLRPDRDKPDMYPAGDNDYGTVSQWRRNKGTVLRHAAIRLLSCMFLRKRCICSNQNQRKRGRHP